MLSSPASLGPPAASLSLCLFVPAQLEPDAVITSAVKGFISRMGSKDVASAANEEMRFFFRAVGCRELRVITGQDIWSFVFFGQAATQPTSYSLPSPELFYFYS